MLHRQRGLSLLWVALFSIAFAAVAMMALFSMRHERNVFAETWGRLTGQVAASPLGAAIDVAKPAAASGAPMRKCVIDGQSVISNVDCKDNNPTSKDIKIYDSHGIEAPKPPPPVADSAPRSDPMIDKAIEKQMH
jgi:hypothetical protein